MTKRGVYGEVVPPEMIVRTERFELGCDAQAGEQLATCVLAEQGGRTTLTLTVEILAWASSADLGALPGNTNA